MFFPHLSFGEISFSSLLFRLMVSFFAFFIESLLEHVKGFKERLNAEDQLTKDELITAFVIHSHSWHLTSVDQG